MHAYIPIYEYIHTYIHTDILFLDPQACHKKARLWNKSLIHKYTNFKCKMKQTFYTNIINHFTHKNLSVEKRSVYVGIFLRLL
jgi:hypothetical protein